MTTSQEFRTIGLGCITPSLTNPRKTFHPARLQELAESIKASGMHQPVLLRFLPGSRAPDTDRSVVYELVAGERRYRASQLAGLDEIPAMIRPLTDDQVLEIQITENLQRDDLTALEEAEGYEFLMEHSGLNADQVGTKIGKSRAYVYARLKLLDLCQDARQYLRDGKLDASRALLVARIPNEKMQIKAAAEIVKGEGRWNGSKYAHEPMSHRAAAAYIQQHYMLQLKHAVFKIDSADLVPTAGACTSCAKRTGASPELFDDVKSADMCTDTTCFNAKEAAHTAAQVATAQAKGQTVIAGKEAAEIAHGGYGNNKFKGYRRLDHKDDSPTDVPLRKIIGAAMKAQGITPVLIAHPTQKGEMVECLANDVVLRLLKELEGQAAAAKTVSKEVKKFAEEKKEKAAQKALDRYEHEWRAELVEHVWDTLEIMACDSQSLLFTMKLHRFLAMREANNTRPEDAEALCKLLHLGKVGGISALIDHAKTCAHPDALHMLMIAQRDSHAGSTYAIGHTQNEGMHLVAGIVFGDGLAATIQGIQTEAHARNFPKPQKAPLPLASAAQAGGVRGGAKAQKPGAKAPAARAAKLSAEDAMLGIAAAMQGVEQTAAAPGGAVAPSEVPASDAGEDLYARAVTFIQTEKKASVRAFKGAFSIGQNRAEELLGQLEAAGLISGVDATGKRTVVAA